MSGRKKRERERQRERYRRERTIEKIERETGVRERVMIQV